MIRNPWPLHWKMPTLYSETEYNNAICQYDKRHTLICTVSYHDKKTACKDCYMRQQSMTLYQMLREGAVIDRVCDRCREPIENPDTAMYLTLEGRKGELVLNVELCRECVAELSDWMSGIELPTPTDLDDEEFENFWD